MAGFENQRFINAPPTLTLPVKADRLDTDKKAAVVKSIKTLKTAVAKLKELIELAKVDLTVLSDLIYKNHNRFRNDKGFRDHKIVKKLAIRVYTEVKLDTLLSQFLDNFPVAFDIKNLSVGGPPIYLPVSHMAEFVMVRLHGTAKLLLALIQRCENAGAKSRQRMGLGHFWNVALYFSACVSRIWALSLSALSTLTGVYEAFVRIHPCLPSHQSEWLPQGYKLPSSDLLVAITDNAQHLETVRKKLRDNCNAVKTRTTPAAETSNLFKDEGTQNVVHHQEPSQQPLDVGVVIDRNSLKLAENVLQEVAELQPQQPAKDKTAGSSEIPAKKWRKFVKAAGQASTSPESLLRFVSEESLHRKRDRKSALTKSLNQDQWKEMRGQIKEAASQLNSEADSQLVKIGLRSVSRSILHWMADPSFKGQKPGCWDKTYAKFSG